MTSPGQSTTSPARSDDDVIEIARDLIRIDTTNPGDGTGPGERAAAEHVAAILDDLGLEPRLVESEPGRASVLARWQPTDPAAAARPALLVHGHLDVVPANAADWTVDPFAGEIADDCLWGRGAVDMKDFDAIVLATLRKRIADGRAPARPVTLAFTADEEAGSGLGARFLVDEHADHFDGCTEAIGEVGGFSLTVDGRRLYLIQTAEKGLAWMRLRATGVAAHGSMVADDNAVVELARAVTRIGEHRWPVQLTAGTRGFFEGLSDALDLGIDVDQDDLAPQLDKLGSIARMIGAAMRHTSNPTMLTAGYKANVIPGDATATVDGRFLPGFEDEFFATIDGLLGDRVERESIVTNTAVETTFDGDLVAAMISSLNEHDPDAAVVPFLMSGGTDAKDWTRLGIRCFGFSPLRLRDDLDFSAMFHGRDERVPLDALRFGTQVLDTFLDRA